MCYFCTRTRARGHCLLIVTKLAAHLLACAFTSTREGKKQQPGTCDGGERVGVYIGQHNTALYCVLAGTRTRTDT